jgi:hypothetical protein
MSGDAVARASANPAQDKTADNITPLPSRMHRDDIAAVATKSPSTVSCCMQCASCKLFDRRDSNLIEAAAGWPTEEGSTLTQHLSAAHLRSPLAMSAAESSSVSSSGQSGGGSGGAASTAEACGENESSSNCTIVPLRSVSEPSRTFLTAALAAAHAAEFGGRSEATRIAHYSAEPDDPAVRLRMLPPCTHTCNACMATRACAHVE